MKIEIEVNEAEILDRVVDKLAAKLEAQARAYMISRLKSEVCTHASNAARESVLSILATRSFKNGMGFSDVVADILEKRVFADNKGLTQYVEGAVVKHAGVHYGRMVADLVQKFSATLSDYPKSTDD